MAMVGWLTQRSCPSPTRGWTKDPELKINDNRIHFTKQRTGIKSLSRFDFHGIEAYERHQTQLNWRTLQTLLTYHNYV